MQPDSCRSSRRPRAQATSCSHSQIGKKRADRPRQRHFILIELSQRRRATARVRLGETLSLEKQVPSSLPAESNHNQKQPAPTGGRQKESNHV